MSTNAEEVQADWIASLKSKVEITSLLTNKTGEEVRECEYQSDKFSFPNIRVGVDFTPSINGCGPDDATIHVEIFSEEKSSKQASHLASIITQIYHKVPFRINGRRYSVVVVEKIQKPIRSIYAWKREVPIHVQVV